MSSRLYLVTIKRPEGEPVEVGRCPATLNENCTHAEGEEHTVAVQAPSSIAVERVIKQRGYEILRIEQGWILEVC